MSSPSASQVRIDHYGLNVPNLEQAVSFFQEAFNAQVVFRLARMRDPDGGSMQRIGADPRDEFEVVMLDLAGQRLELLQWWSPQGTRRPLGATGHGASHLGMTCPDLAATLNQLRRMPGVTVLGEPQTFTEGPTPGLTNAFVLTPWGSSIELVNWGVQAARP
ncbi:VOC family protein [Paenarthrobacter sp. A20]|uniref:VOC family protein n=1 Tax=Paenarthrobacter sp. A20 TaxID=2817891 RepID=UPI0035A819C5|nr:catechol 2,3-dioxygenase-like lactoylglutathione lyase family enzyme [Paenarthrobacter sp. A20]